MFAAKRETENIKLELTLNFDQVWRLKYRGRKRVLHKSKKDQGKLRSRLEGTTGRKRKTKRMAKEVRRRLRQKTPWTTEKPVDADLASEDAAEDSLDADSEDEKKAKRSKTKHREGLEGKDEVFVVPVTQDRMPHTCTTSIWGNGAKGPLTLVFGEGQFPRRLIDSLNAKYRGKAYVMTSGRDTHFMDTDSTIHMWDNVFGPAIAQRRAQLGLGKEHKASLMSNQVDTC